MCLLRLWTNIFKSISTPSSCYSLTPRRLWPQFKSIICRCLAYMNYNCKQEHMSTCAHIAYFQKKFAGLLQNFNLWNSEVSFLNRVMIKIYNMYKHLVNIKSQFTYSQNLCQVMTVWRFDPLGPDQQVIARADTSKCPFTVYVHLLRQC